MNEDTFCPAGGDMWYVFQLSDSVMVLTKSWNLKDPGQAANNRLNWPKLGVGGWGGVEIEENRRKRASLKEGSLYWEPSFLEFHRYVGLRLLYIFVPISTHTRICIYVLNNSVFFSIFIVVQLLPQPILECHCHSRRKPHTQLAVTPHSCFPPAPNY